MNSLTLASFKAATAVLAVIAMLAVTVVDAATARAAVNPTDPVVNITAAGDAPSQGSSVSGVSTSADGRYVVYRSTASNLTADADNGVSDVFLYDRDSEATLNITAAGDGASQTGVISPDGSTIVFSSFATNLTADIDATGHQDVFSYDIASQAITRVTGPLTASGSGSFLDVSGDGSLVTFTSAHNFAGTNDGWANAYIWDRSTGAYTKLSEGLSGNASFGSISADGSVVAFSVFSGSLSMYLFDVASGTATMTNPPTAIGGYASPSDDGLTLAVSSIDPINATSLIWKLDRSDPALASWDLLAGSATIDASNFALSGDGTQLFYLNSVFPGVTNSAVRLDLATSQSVTLFTALTNAWDFGSNVDGSVVAFAGEDSQGPRDVFVAAENFDLDGDGFEGANGDGSDCDDGDPAINPNAVEIPYNGIDEDCDGADLVDVDGDGSPSTATTGGTPDCDDSDPTINPNAVEIAGDGIDQDCDGGDLSAQMCDGLAATIDMTTGAPGTGTAGDDVIFGTPSADVIDGMGGNDTICGEGGNDTISGGDGVDFIFGGTGDDTMTGGLGNDRIRGNEGVDVIDGGLGNDFLYGGIEGDTIVGGDGDDTIGGFGGADTIDAGPGDDIVFGGFGADTINAGDGDDVVNGLIGNDVINGGTGNDTLNGDRGLDTIRGDAGNDVINGGNSDDTLFGDGGDDSVNGGKGDDTLSGGTNDDMCTGNRQNIADTADATCEQTFGIP